MATILHLSDGTMIMGEIEESSSGKKALVLKNPIEIIMTMSSESTYAFYGREWMPFTDQKEVTLNADHVIAFGTPSERVVKYYQKLLKEDDETMATLDESSELDQDTLSEAIDLLAKQKGRYH